MSQNILFAGKYRIASHRRQGWDYSDRARYFVTICTQHKYPYFGEVKNGIMRLNEMGCVVVDEIQKTNIVRDNVKINDWVLMPDHIHMIVCIHDYLDCDLVEVERRSTSTSVAQCLPLPRRKPNSIGSIVQNIKSQSTKRIRQQYDDGFRWQRNYHDRIIRNDREHYRKLRYIQQNPARYVSK